MCCACARVCGHASTCASEYVRLSGCACVNECVLMCVYMRVHVCRRAYARLHVCAN